MKEIFLINQDHLREGIKEYGFLVTDFDSQELAIEALRSGGDAGTGMPAAVLCDYQIDGAYKEIINAAKGINVPVIVLSHITDDLAKQDAFTAGATDFFTYGLDLEQLAYRINSLDDWSKEVKRQPIKVDYKVPAGKRVFDVVVSILVITLLLPVFIVVALLIKLTSSGPVFCSSMRVGTGYTVFPLYQFRTAKQMQGNTGSKTKLPGFIKRNTAIKKGKNEEVDTSPMLVGDDLYISEEYYREKRRIESQEALINSDNTPEVTGPGHFIRKSGICELPQFFNVLLGHMSIVGNRPLPLHEAERLTSDAWTLRFLAPAGITGLWQLTESSENHREKLDLIYAQKYSFWMDLKILLNILDRTTRKSLEMHQN